MKILIVENELNTREVIKKMVAIISPQSTIVGETGYVKEAKELITKLKPNVILLDIELEDGTGFDLLESLDSHNFRVIFTTAYNQYAIQAFKFSATDYILKPIDPSELKDSLDKIDSLINIENKQLKLIQTLRDNLENKNKKIVLKTSDNTHFIDVNDIIRLEADGAYTSFITENKTIVVSKNLKFYEGLLDDSFIRCHQSHIVNSTKITSLDKTDNLVLQNGNKVPVSSRKKTITLQYIGNVQGNS